MAITFRKGPTTLVKELERAGYRIADVLSDAGDPRRSLQILLKNGAVVNWDRDSHSVWAEGPAPVARRLESVVDHAGRRRVISRTRRTRVLAYFCAVILCVAALAAIYLKAQRSPPPAAPAPVGAAE